MSFYSKRLSIGYPRVKNKPENRGRKTIPEPEPARPETRGYPTRTEPLPSLIIGALEIHLF